MLIIDSLTMVPAVDNLSHELIFKDHSSTVKNLVKHIVDKIFTLTVVIVHVQSAFKVKGKDDTELQL